jgi:hypothetical protein
MSQPPDVNAAVTQIESLLDELAASEDARVRPKAEQLVQLLMEVYGAGIGRMLAILRDAGDAGQGVLDRFAGDKLVASLLLVHGLHPLDAETRIRQALERLERRLDSERIAFEGISEGVARVRIENSGNGGSAGALKAAIERAVADAAPDVDAVEIDVPSQFVQIALSSEP